MRPKLSLAVLVYDKRGTMVLRVDNTIDGFPALLYHVNRKTLPRYAAGV